MRKFIVVSLMLFPLLIQLAIAQSSTGEWNKVMSPAEMLKFDMDYSQRLQDNKMLGAAMDAMRDGIRRYADSLKLQSDLVPISYTNEIRTAKHERMKGWVYAKGDTNTVIGWQSSSTNLPVAIIHSVTYGRGTNAVFVLKTCETLTDNGKWSVCGPSGSNGWQNVECVIYNPMTWVESPK